VSAVLITRVRAGREEALLARTSADPTLTPLFEFPHTGYRTTTNDLAPTAIGIRARILERYGLVLDDVGRAPVATTSHAITTRRIRASLYRGTLGRRAPRRLDIRWVSLDGAPPPNLSLGAMTSKLRRRLREAPPPIGRV
jgi:hypothetical protein